MRSRKDELEEIVGEEEGAKAELKAKRKEAVERRRGQKKRDKIARWSGFILLLGVMMLGFLLWVAGEM